MSTPGPASPTHCETVAWARAVPCASDTLVHISADVVFHRHVLRPASVEGEGRGGAGRGPAKG
jgi:hypothetical protein